MDQVFALQLPYFQIIHILVVSIRIGSMLLFAPIWGSPAIPRPVRLLLVFCVFRTILNTDSDPS